MVILCIIFCLSSSLIAFVGLRFALRFCVFGVPPDGIATYGEENITV